MKVERDPSGLLLRCHHIEGKSQFHFLMPTTVGEADRAAAAASLDNKGYAILDGVMGADTSLALREQGLRLYNEQPSTFHGGAVGGGADGDGDRYSVAAVRGDAMAILESGDSRIPLLQPLVDRFDALVQHLAAIGSGACEELKRVDHRSKPMLAIYPGKGSRYMRHIDNPDGNGRLLTCLYYLNAGWRAGDGGELRLWHADGETPMATIPPLLDRLVLFWSDSRVPHEVLAAYTERMALSVWFHTPDEGEAAVASASSAAAMRAVAAAAATTRDDKAAWQRAQVLASGSQAEQQRQQAAEDAYLAAVKRAANGLRSKGHVTLQLSDPHVMEALGGLRPQLTTLGAAAAGGGGHGGGGDGAALQWVAAPLVEGKLKILLHQMWPSAELAAGCTQLMLARSAGDTGVHWLSKPKGAKALVLMLLGSAAAAAAADGAKQHAPTEGDNDEDDDCVVTVHARIRAVTIGDTRPPPGWPRASGPCVMLDDTPGMLHVFDCSVHPLHVRLSDADVAGLWSFGHVEGGDGVIARLQAETRLAPER